MDLKLIISFLFMMFLVCGVLILWLRNTFLTSTEGALKRLDDETAKAAAKQAELTRRIQEADSELEKRRSEAKELADKMRSTAEEEARAEKEKIIKKARDEGEEIIANAQTATEKMKLEMEKDLDIRGVDFGIEILNKVFSEKTKGSFEELLIADFIENLKTMDMSRISPDVATVDVITVNPIKENYKSEILKIIKDKLQRDIQINPTTDEKISGGIILRFGSMALDSSLRFIFKEEARKMKESIEATII